MIMYVRRRTYLVGYDKMLGRCIRNVSFYWHERYAIGEGAILGYPNARYMLCRLFVTEENSRFLTLLLDRLRRNGQRHSFYQAV